MKKINLSKLSKWNLFAVFAGVVCLLVICAVWYYKNESKTIRAEKYRELSMIAEMKAESIIHWREMRAADARLLSSLISGIRLENGRPVSPGQILAVMEKFADNKNYENIMLCGKKGQVLLSLPVFTPLQKKRSRDGIPTAVGTTGRLLDLPLKDREKGLNEETRKLVSYAEKSRRVVLGEPFNLSSPDNAYLDTAAPVSGKDGEISSVLLLRIDINKELLKILEVWPLPSRSGETLLVRKEKAEVLFLSKFRDSSSFPLSRRIPLTSEDLPAVQAVLGKKGEFSGLDYRNVKVMADLRPLSGSSWFLVTKIDSEEILSELKYRARIVATIVTITFLLTLMILLFLFSYKRKNFYKSFYLLEKEKEAVQETLEKSEENSLVQHAILQKIIDSINDPIFSLDRNYCYTSFNHAHYKIMQTIYGVEIRLGLSLLDCQSNPEDRMKAKKNIDRALSGDTVIEESYSGEEHKSNKYFMVSHYPVENEKNETIGATVLSKDITHRKEAEEEKLKMNERIQRTQRLESLGVLAGGVAHDFNNILMAILGYSEIALNEMGPMSPARENISEVIKATNNAAGLCRQMLAYSGRGNFVLAPVNIESLINEMAHLLKTSISKRAILNLSLAKNLPFFLGDMTQVRQILLNLTINASEAIGERSGVIGISTGAIECKKEYLETTYLNETLTEGLYVTLEVSDTGCGMDLETQKKIFEPFFTTKFIGRGLGMSAVLGIMRAHKGAIKIYSEIGKGTTFKCLFPALEENRLEENHETDGKMSDYAFSGTVLFVDDEETVRAVGKKQLERFGFSVLTASDGREALEVYKKNRDIIKLIILDMTMPHMNGEETFRALRLLNPGVKVILSSGYSESDIISQFSGKGLAGFIQKPYTLSELGALLKKSFSYENPLKNGE